jgi:transposase InsO family protein
LSAKDRVGLLEIIKIAQAEGVTCERSCKLLELNPRTVYRWRNDRISDCHGGGGGQNKITEAEEKTVVEWARAHPDQRCRRIAYELERAEKAFIGKTKVAAILKKHGINHPFEKGKGRPDIPPQDMLLHEPWKVNLLWGMDWTWVRVNGKFMFLLVLLDWYSRKILAWGLFWQITRIEVVAIVTDAVAKEDIENLPEKTLRPIVVADHGSANSCNHTRTNIEFLGLDLWLSGVGRPTGNARTERVIGTLKREEILLQDEYKNETQAQEKIGHSIFDYNNLRPNAGNGGFAPSIVHQHGRRIPTEKRLMNRQKTETERRNHSKTNQGSLPS